MNGTCQQIGNQRRNYVMIVRIRAQIYYIRAQDASGGPDPAQDAKLQPRRTQEAQIQPRTGSNPEQEGAGGQL